MVLFLIKSYKSRLSSVVLKELKKSLYVPILSVVGGLVVGGFVGGGINLFVSSKKTQDIGQYKQGKKKTIGS